MTVIRDMIILLIYHKLKLVIIQEIVLDTVGMLTMVVRF